MRHIGKSAAALAAGLAAVVVAGCGTSPAAPATPTGSPPVPSAGQVTPATGHVGADCGVIPDSGPGSFRWMAGRQVMTSISGNPELTSFSSAVKSASLTGELNGLRSFTLFVPSNSAFADLRKSELSYLRNRANLARLVRGLAAPAHVTPVQIAMGSTVTTLSGRKLTLGKSGSSLRVNQATVVCGNIKTANATVYLIDQVPLPPR